MQSKSIITQTSRSRRLLLLRCNPAITCFQTASPMLKLKSHRGKSQYFISLQHHCIKKRWRGKTGDKHRKAGSQYSSLRENSMTGLVPVWWRGRR